MRSLVHYALQKIGLAQTEPPAGLPPLDIKPEHPMVPLQREIDFPFFPFVPSISLELTDLCNLKCPYCANQSLTRHKGKIRWDLLEKIVDECSREHYRLGSLHGTGEPLLYDQLEEVIRLIRSRDVGQGSFATNATFLTPDRARSLIQAGLRSICISLDTLDPVIYRQTRGADLAQVVRNIQDLIALAPKDFGIYIYLMEHKDQQLNDDVWRKFRDTFGTQPNVIGQPAVNGKLPSALADYRVRKRSTEMCFSPSKWLFITYEGKAAVCCADQDVLHELGDVSRQTIKEVWYSPRAQSTMRNIALGVLDCPAVCTERCQLRPPKQNVTEVHAAYGLPFDQAFALAQHWQAHGYTEPAHKLAELLKKRAPWDNHPIFQFLNQPWSLVWPESH